MGNRSKDNKDAVDYSSLAKASEVFVSEDDINTPLCQKVILEGVKSGVLKEVHTIDDILYHIWGCNLDFGYEIHEGLHKTRFGKTFDGKRYCFFERYDDDWYENGMISVKMRTLRENIVARQNHERW